MALATETGEGTAFITHPDPMLGKKICLDIGSGPEGLRRHPVFSGEHWRVLRVDANKSVSPDFHAKASDLSTIATDYADAIWCKSLIDHLRYHELVAAFKEFRRVLRPGAAAIIVVYDADLLHEFGRKHGYETVRYRYGKEQLPVTALDQLRGNRHEIAAGLSFMEKHWEFTAPTLTKYLEDAGFSDVRVERNNEWMQDALYARAWK